MNVSSKYITNTIRNPFFWFLLAFFVLGLVRTQSFGSKQNKVIGSDGRGYYAYLPAIFLQKDASFTKTLEVEGAYLKTDSQYYIFENSKHERFNKFFPGIAVLQAPFFAIACGIEYMRGDEITGYSNTFTNLFYIGHLFYALLGLILFSACIKRLYPTFKNRNLIISLVFIATPLLFYSVETSLSHSYTFLLYGIFTWLILDLKQKLNFWSFLKLGLVLGIITITRPTNLIILSIAPFLLGSLKSTIDLLKEIFVKHLAYLFAILIGFFVSFSIQLFVWKWQSGHWFFWPYNGEGLNWFDPMIWETLFSYRTGLFVHTPILFISALASWFIFKENRFQFVIWWLYFALNTYVIGSWWCWDYETPFGHRPFTEHLFFLVLPLFYLNDWKPKIALSIISLCAFLGIIRYTEYISDYMTNQRFTKENYFRSLAFWKPWNFDRWAFTQSCEPFGKRIMEKELVFIPEETKITKDMEYIHTIEVELPPNHLDTRFFVKVYLDKKIDGQSLEDVLLIKDAYSTTSDKSCYLSLPIWNDKLEGQKEFVSLELSEAIPDNFSEYNRVKIYIWNLGKKELSIKNYRVVLEQYSSVK